MTTTSIAHDAISIDEVVSRPTVRSYRFVQLKSARGTLEAYHFPVIDHKVVLYVGGDKGDGFASPAVHLFNRIAEDMQHRHVAGFRIRLRQPDDLQECVYDLRVALHFLREEGYTDILLVAYSLGAEAALQMARTESDVQGLALLAPSVAPLFEPGALALDHGILLIHGGQDTIFTLKQARGLYERLGAEKDLLVLPRSKHTLTENSTDVHFRLREWLHAWKRETQV